MNNRLLFHYQQELGLVHHLSEEFSKAHPKIARRLRLDGKNIADPETARLLQTFALSNARLSYDLEDDFSFLSDALLNTFHPHLNAPLPAFSIAQFQPSAIKLNNKLNLSKHLLLQSTTKNNEHCFFRTCYDVDIFPVIITEAELISKPAIMPAVSFLTHANAFLRIRLKGLDEKIHLPDVDIEKLRFFINLPSALAYKLYELIFNHSVGVVAASSNMDTSPIILSVSDIQPVGFNHEEEILPYRDTINFSYRLLMDFFAFPEKFLFFDINHLSQIITKKCTQSGDSLDIIFYFDQTDNELEKNIKSDNFKLFCTPVINLFDAEISRIEIKPSEQKYLLPTDKNLEIYAVNKITLHDDDQQEKTLEPFFSDIISSSMPHYHVLRKPAWEAGEYLKPGSESFLYFQRVENFFVDTKNPYISSKVLCTNRDLPTQLDTENKNTRLHLVENRIDAIKEICFLKKITPSSYSFMQPGLSWQYLSTLNLNYFSLTNDQEGLNALRNLLSIYMCGIIVNKIREEILSGFLSIRTQMITVRSTYVRENRFCQGVQITLQLDEAKFSAIGLYLFCHILANFFTGWFSKNSTIVLVILSSSGKELYSVKPRYGER